MAGAITERRSLGGNQFMSWRWLRASSNQSERSPRCRLRRKRHIQLNGKNRAAAPALIARNLAYPLDLELDLFFVFAPLVFDVVSGADRHGYALARNLDFKALAAFQRVSKTAKLFHELNEGVVLLNISGWLRFHYHLSKSYLAPSVVQLEARYAADGVFTTAERTEMIDHYGELTQRLADGGYADTGAEGRGPVSDGRAEFAARVAAAVTARRLTRVAATRLKADYVALVQVEAGYLRDGRLTETERDALDQRLEALDARLDGATVAATPRTRLDAIVRAMPASRLSAAAQAQLRIEHGDLVRLAAAYERVAPTTDERAYLERRLVNLETRAKVVR